MSSWIPNTITTGCDMQFLPGFIIVCYCVRCLVGIYNFGYICLGLARPLIAAACFAYHLEVCSKQESHQVQQVITETRLVLLLKLPYFFQPLVQLIIELH